MVLLCGDGSIGPLNLQRTINSGGGEGGAVPMGFCLHVHVSHLQRGLIVPLVVLGGGMCGFPWFMYM